jgi:hypothetical protein
MPNKRKHAVFCKKCKNYIPEKKYVDHMERHYKDESSGSDSENGYSPRPLRRRSTSSCNPFTIVWRTLQWLWFSISNILSDALTYIISIAVLLILAYWGITLFKKHGFTLEHLMNWISSFMSKCWSMITTLVTNPSAFF